MIKYKDNKIVNMETYEREWMTNPPQKICVEIPILEKDILEGHSIWFYRKVCPRTFKVTEKIIKKTINYMPSEDEAYMYSLTFIMYPMTINEYLDIWESQANPEFIINYRNKKL